MTRVAITDYTAVSRFGEIDLAWHPQSENWWQPPAIRPIFSENPSILSSHLGWEWAENFFERQDFSCVAPGRLAVSFGSSKGWISQMKRWAEPGSAKAGSDESGGVEPFCDFDARSLAARISARGQVLCPVAACATGAHALALGAKLIELGRADVVVAGASEPPQPEIILAAYKNMGALSKSRVMRPFDARRDGFLPAWGGGLFTLENEARARSRGAKIHGFLTGYSLHCDATHLTSMNPSGAPIARAIEDGLHKAGNPRIDYINAHGTATKANDLIESRALESVFGTRVPISSTKPLTGHLLGAAGAVEAAICLLAMRDNFAPPTLNLESRDSELELDFLPLCGRKTEIGAVLSLNYGFGGHIGALIFEKN